jgi:hypothetical protein
MLQGDWLIIYCFTSRLRIFHLYEDVTIAGVTERSDSRRILTPGSFFYEEMWPPGQYSTAREVIFLL